MRPMAIIPSFLVAASATFSAVPNVKIAPNVEMPMLAFGSYKASLSGCTVQEGVEQWLRLGGRHIDTADDYGTQLDVGRAVKASGVHRKDIFITTKVPGPIGKKAVQDKILHTALPQLGVDYLDLVLIHFPCKGHRTPPVADCSGQAEDRRETWAGLAELRAQRKIRAVGVSNYNIEQVDEIIAAFNEPPAVNQVQYHLAYHNDTLLQYMKEAGTVLEAWASLGGPTAQQPTISLGDSRLKEVAARYNASTPQVVFRWETQKGVVPVTATCTETHAVGDLASFSFQLSEEDVTYLDTLMPTEHLIV